MIFWNIMNLMNYTDKNMIIIEWNLKFISTNNKLKQNLDVTKKNYFIY